MSLSLHSPWGVTRCHCGRSVPLVSHGAVMQPCGMAQHHCCSPGCHMVSLSPHSAQGVTVTVGPLGATQCHCSSRGLSHRVTISAWSMGCHIVLCHCMAHGVSHRVTITAVPQCITQCCCHCVAHGVSPSVTITAWPGVSHTVQDTPRCHSPHILWAVTQCHCTPLAVSHPVPTSPGTPWGQHSRSQQPKSPWGTRPRSCPLHPPSLLPGEQPLPVTQQR